MSIKIRVLQFKRGLLDRLTAAGILPGEPAIAWDDDTKPRLLIGDRMGVPRELAVGAHQHPISGVEGLQAALNLKAWAGGDVDWSQLQNTPSSYPPPVASAAMLGGVKPGNGVEVNLAGFLTVTFAESAGAVAWANVSGRPSNVSDFANDVGYITGINGPMVDAALGYTPAEAVHTHVIADTPGLQTALDAAKPQRVSMAIPLPTATGTVDLGKSFLIEGEVASAAGRFRLYRTEAGRDTDLARATGTDAPSSVGQLLEDTFTAVELSIQTNPAPGAPSGGTLCAWSWSGAIGSTVTLDVLKLEA